MSSAILDTFPLGFPWKTLDPFLFCVYHKDAYPKGNAQLGPATSLEGRHIGQDFTLKEGWRMYHGDVVPGFPAHPHRGFETLTIVEKGWVDHADSLGASGRYGEGDMQWMTAGSGVQHSEMFPLLSEGSENPLELFQIWLNLPKKSKMVEPHFKMLWKEKIPLLLLKDEAGNNIQIKLFAGEYSESFAPEPAPDSWAHDSANQVAVWLIELAPEAHFELPVSEKDLNRVLYFYEGKDIEVASEPLAINWGVQLDASQSVSLKNGSSQSKLLFLQGRPLKEAVVQYGPFVMNSQDEIQSAFEDYQRTQFGGWPWPKSDQTHSENGRFAKYADGKEETPSSIDLNPIFKYVV